MQTTPDIVNELTTYIVNLAFTNEAGQPVTPTSGTYRIDDVASRQEVKGATAFVPSSDTHDLVIVADDNAILNDKLTLEQRRVTVVVEYGDNSQITGEHVYYVRNLRGVAG